MIELRWLCAAVLAAGCHGDPSTGGSDGGAGGGCPNDAPKSCPAGAAGYKEAVAPILGTSCGSCHRPGGTSLIYLQTYDEVFAQRASVLDQVYSCRMPPPDYPPLNPTERADLLGWLVCGAPND
jgi:hypothetical protein